MIDTITEKIHVPPKFATTKSYDNKIRHLFVEMETILTKFICKKSEQMFNQIHTHHLATGIKVIPNGPTVHGPRKQNRNQSRKSNNYSSNEFIKEKCIPIKLFDPLRG